MAGGPRNLYNHLKRQPTSAYRVLTSYLNFSYGKLDPTAWLPVEYDFFDSLAQPSRQAEQITVDPQLLRYRKIDAIDLRLQRYLKFSWLTRAVNSVLYQFNRSLRVLFAGLKIIRSEKISAIVLISDMGWGMVGGYLLSVLTFRPLVVFFFDLYADNYLPTPNKILAKIFEPFIFFRAKRILVTNETTRDYYLQKYGTHCPPISLVRNSSDSPVRDLSHTPYQLKAPYKIIFGGHVYWPQQESLFNLLDAMTELQDLPVSLELFVLNPPAELQERAARHPNVTIRQAPRQELAQIIEKATLLFLPFGWNTPCPDIIATASPAKLTDYLASGTPILVHAPETAFVSQFVRQHRCGLVVPENSPHQLAQAIRNYLTGDEDRGREMSQRAVDIFSTEFNVALNADRFLDAVREFT